jgi:Site-specific recombinase XerC
MPRRGENIYKRKDGRWEGRILQPDGKYRYVYAKSYKEVRDKQKNYKDYIKPNTIITAANGAYGQFESWLYEVRNHVKASTYGNYYYCINKYVLPFYSTVDNECLNMSSVSEFTRSIRDCSTLSDAYKRKLLTIFKTALKELLKGYSDYTDILAAVKLPKTNNAEVQAFSIGDQRLIENAALHSTDIRAFGIILTFYTGIRLGELCALKWNDIDIDSGIMYVAKTVTRVKNSQNGIGATSLLVGTPKSNKSIRKIPLPKFLLNMIRETKRYCVNENCYLISGTYAPIDPRVYQNIYKKVLKNAGVKYHKFHAIRHTFATRALELGVDIKTLSEILGHSNVSITLNIYAHSMMEQKKIAMDRFNELHTTHMEITAFAVGELVNKA